MLRYRLDDLGWYAFESLTQSLLKAWLGLRVESWGTRGDWGRDAFSRRSLKIKGREVPGPVVFQVKFVEGANAAGADWKPAIMAAARHEVARIAERRTKHRWIEPQEYFLLTNAQLDAKTREDLREVFLKALPSTAITLYGASDLCDLLDQHPVLRKSFPELLSLRDLDHLLREVVHRGILERSSAAIDESRDLVPVFVPTRAYRQAWRILGRHRFVVLDGPPEMGKTAIARMIAIGHLLRDWSVVECRGPDDFFSAFDKDERQIFIADDAFGRTEFDPTLARQWERDLPRVLLRLDARHRLIWTSRKHILQRAIREMDLTGAAKSFPDPAEVVVTAADLTVEEKARILYRHAKTGTKRARGRGVIRASASEIVHDEHFTPERIRRAVVDVLPELLRERADVDDKTIADALLDSVRHPTDRMTKAFRKLPEEHQLMLVAMLEAGHHVTDDLLLTHYGRLREAPADTFELVLDDLAGTFLKHRGDTVEWIHPSYRDLVIDELIQNTRLRQQFLSVASPAGIGLAVSKSGGRRGERQFPLIRDSMSLALLGKRAAALAESASDDDVLTVLLSLSIAMANDAPETAGDELLRIAQSMAQALMMRWHRNPPTSVSPIRNYLDGVRYLPGCPLPPIYTVWLAAADQIESSLNAGTLPPAAAISEWSALRDLVEKEFPVDQWPPEFLSRSERIADSIFELADRKSSGTPFQLAFLSKVLATVERSPAHTKIRNKIAEAATTHAIVERDDDSFYDYDIDEEQGDDAFDVDEVFSDL